MLNRQNNLAKENNKVRKLTIPSGDNFNSNVTSNHSNTTEGITTCYELKEQKEEEGETENAGNVINSVSSDLLALIVLGNKKLETRYDWSPFDPLLVAEGAFALANIHTFGRLLQTVAMISGSLGVLAISLFGMVGDIVKFLILFSMTLISFAMGMTQLYQPFDVLKMQLCEDETGDCPDAAFIRCVLLIILRIT